MLTYLPCMLGEKRNVAQPATSAERFLSKEQTRSIKPEWRQKNGRMPLSSLMALYLNRRVSPIK